MSAEIRAAEEAAWRTALAPLDRLGRRGPELADWGGDRGTVTLLRRLSGTPAVAGRLAANLVEVLAALPADGAPLARLAARTTGDAHALDAGRPLATLVLSAVRAVWWPGDDEPTSPAERRRALWDSVGVLVDELSSTVLVLNVTATPGSRLHALTAPAALAGEPLVLTLRQLGRERPSFPAGAVYVCENPTVLAAAADLLGPACPPLVCVNGQPSTAALRLLTGLIDQRRAAVLPRRLRLGRRTDRQPVALARPVAALAVRCRGVPGSRRGCRRGDADRPTGRGRLGRRADRADAPAHRTRRGGAGPRPAPRRPGRCDEPPLALMLLCRYQSNRMRYCVAMLATSKYHDLH